MNKIPEENLFYFNGDHGDIVVGFFGLDELVQPEVDALDDFCDRKMRTFLQGRFQAGLIEQVMLGIHGFGDTVGVKQQYIPAIYRYGLFLEA